MPSLLERQRKYSQNPQLSASHIQLDLLSAGFTEQASDLKSFTAITCGGFAYRLGKWVALSQGMKHLAPLAALAAEVSTFRAIHSLFVPKHSSSWLTDYISFGALRAFGRAAQNTNPLLGHSIQDAGMVAAHHLTFALHLTPAPEGSLVEELLSAEIINLQMIGGMALVHQLSQGKILAQERGMELFAQAKRVTLQGQTNQFFKAAQRPAVFTNESSWAISSPQEIVQQYPRMHRLQQSYLDSLRAENAILHEEKIPLWVFVDRLNAAPQWLKDYANQHPDLEIQRVVFVPERLQEDAEKSAFFLGDFMRDIERKWMLEDHSIYRLYSRSGAEEHALSLHLMPAPLLMDARKLAPGRHPISISLNLRLSTPEEVVNMMASDTRPFFIGNKTNDLHGFKNAHPYMQMLHDYVHLLIMDSLTPRQRRNLFEIYQSLARLTPELLEENLKAEQRGHILEGTFYGIHQDMFYFTFRMVDQYNPKALFLKAWQAELEKSFPEDHPHADALFNAFDKIYRKKLRTEN